MSRSRKRPRGFPKFCSSAAQTERGTTFAGRPCRARNTDALGSASFNVPSGSVVATLRQTRSALSPITSSSKARKAVTTEPSSFGTAAMMSGGDDRCAKQPVVAPAISKAAAMVRTISVRDASAAVWWRRKERVCFIC